MVKTRDSILAYYTQSQGLLSYRRDNASCFYHYDGLGSTKVLTDANQNIQNTTKYDAWGNILQSSGTIINPYLYVGELGYFGDGDAGMYLLTQRWYNPVVGRFVVREPSETERWIQINTYAYVMENPVNNTDPLGRFTLIGFPAGISEKIRAEIDRLCNILLPVARATNLCCTGKAASGLLDCLEECCKRGEIIYEGTTSHCNGLANCGFSYWLWFGQKCKAYVCLMGLNESICGPVGSTVAHEWIHSCHHPFEYYPRLVEKCLYYPDFPLMDPLPYA
jgi:RHS repeat-associated protein